MTEKNVILLTGANGFLGGKLVKRLIDTTNYSIIAAASCEEKIKQMLSREDVKFKSRVIPISNEKLLNDEYDLSNIYAAVHMAFSRRMRTDAEIASSIDFSVAVFNKLYCSKVNNIIYLSSAGVYGNTKMMRYEETPPAPNSLYTMAKYAAEKIFDAYFEGCKDINRTCLRLGSVIQSQNLVQTLSKQAKEEKIIRLRGGKQEFKYIDVDDAVEAIISLLKYTRLWAPVYNICTNEQPLNLIEIAQIIVRLARQRGYGEVEIQLDEQPIEIWSQTDASRIMADTGWRPQYNMEQMIERVFDEVS